MDLVLDIPDRWIDDGVSVEIVAPQPIPFDPRAWLIQTLAGEHREVAQIVAARRLETRDGWMFDLHLVRVESQVHVVAIYYFRDHLAAVIVRSERRPPDLEEVLTTARPDWRTDEIVALEDLWR